MLGGILLYGSLKGVESVNLISCWTKSVLPKSVGPVDYMSDHLLRRILALPSSSDVRLSSSICTSIFSGDFVDLSSCFCERAGVHESTTLTLVKEHHRDWGGISIVRADKLQTLTGILEVVPGVFKATTLGQIVKSPDNELSICSVIAV